MEQPVPTLPATWYHGDEIYQRERRGVFAKEWLLAGHTHQLQKPGDYVTVDIAGFPVFVLVDASGEARAFHNVCRHRAAPLLTAPAGNIDAAAIVCRYHGWSYGLDGDFLSAPHFGKADATTCSKLALLPIGVARLGSMVFVNLDPAAKPFDESMKGLVTELSGSGYRVERYRYHSSAVREGRFNWKVWVEGYQECYHCPTIHPIFNKDFVLRNYKVENKERYSVHSCERRVPSASGEFAGLWLWVYPNLGLPCYENAYYSLRVNPLGPTRTQLNYTFHLREDTSDSKAREFLDFVEQVTNEDIDICEGVQRNLEAGIYTQGNLNPQRENGVIYFHEMIRSCVG